MANRITWRQTLRSYDVEVYADGWWYMYLAGSSPAVDPHAVDLGQARGRATRFLAIWAAYVRRWWKDRRG